MRKQKTMKSLSCQVIFSNLMCQKHREHGQEEAVCSVRIMYVIDFKEKRKYLILLLLFGFDAIHMGYTSTH